MCGILKGLGKEDREWRKYNEPRVSTLQMIIKSKLQMIAMKEGAGRKSEVNKLVEDMKQTLNAEQSALPAETINKIKSKDEVT